MKLRYMFSLLCLFLITASVIQPLSAAEPGDTRIQAHDGGALKDVTVKAGEPIKLQAMVASCVYDYDVGYVWVGMGLRYLEFSVFKAKEDGSDGDCVYYNSKMTSFWTGIAKPKAFTLEKGTYNLLVQHNGNLKHCSARAKIYVE